MLFIFKANIDADDDQEITALMLTVRAGNGSVITHLLESGPGIDVDAEEKRYALRSSPVCGSEGIIRPILVKYHDLDLQESLERTALHHSTRCANMASIFLNHAAKSDSTDKHGHIPSSYVGRL